MTYAACNGVLQRTTLWNVLDGMDRPTGHPKRFEGEGVYSNPPS